MSTKCLECGKEVESGLDLCSRCEEVSLQMDLQFDDFFKTLPQTSTSEVKPHYPVVKLSPTEIGFRVPSWQEECQRMLKICRISYPQCLADYIGLVHQVCIDRQITFWNSLLVVVNFFKKDWCISKYFDRGEVEDPKKGIKARTRGWKLAIFNPFNYMEWAKPGFAKWVNITMKGLGKTRKDLVKEAEEIVNEHRDSAS